MQYYVTLTIFKYNKIKILLKALKIKLIDIIENKSERASRKCVQIYQIHIT